MATSPRSQNGCAPPHTEARSWPKREGHARSSPCLAPHVQACCAEDLCQPRRLSPPPILSGRDTCRLCFTFLRAHPGVAPSALPLADGAAQVGRRFLHYREQERGPSGRSRNRRLSALRACWRWVALRDPARLGVVTRRLAMPRQRAARQLIASLTRTDMQALLAASDPSTWARRRDEAVLLPLANRGARGSAVTPRQREQVRVGASPVGPLTGQGRQARTVPLWSATAQGVNAWFEELGADAGPLAFPPARGQGLSREGVDDRLQQAMPRARPACPSLATTPITPQVMRHATALPRLQAGGDLATIARGLGHQSIQTTHVYRQAKLKMPETAWEQLEPIAGVWKRFPAEDPLRTFLNTL